MRFANTKDANFPTTFDAWIRPSTVERSRRETVLRPLENVDKSWASAEEASAGAGEGVGIGVGVIDGVEVADSLDESV